MDFLRLFYNKRKDIRDDYRLWSTKLARVQPVQRQMVPSRQKRKSREQRKNSLFCSPEATRTEEPRDKTLHRHERDAESHVDNMVIEGETGQLPGGGSDS